ncbi:MAG: TlpA family protein disulfide reductase, partial [Pirellulaceae bacterium]|nr:TlpA family protein disulfide reductase [Pirellulaceae bacterium]
NDEPVPDGTPEELMAYIRRVGGQRPAGNTEEEQIASFRQMNEKIIAAADKILASSAPGDIGKQAVQIKLNAFRGLAEVGTPDIMPRIRTFCQELRQSGNLEYARLGRMILFGMQVGSLAAGESDDVKSVMNELDAMLVDREWIAAEGQGEQVFGLTYQAAIALQTVGKFAEAGAAFQRIGETFQTHPNPEIATEAKNLLERSALVQADFDGKRDAALFDKPEAMEPFMGLVRQLLAGQNPGPYLLQQMLDAGQYMEFTQHPDSAREIYSLVGQAYQGHPNQELAAQAAERTTNGTRRLDLLGKPFVVEGVLPDGTPFDWSAYQGKVVLVDFWASWCQPCIAEIPNIAKNLELYRSKGFDVVGVNLDENPEDRQNFLQRNQLPWATVISANPEAQGFDNPLAVKCGIDAIPFLVLVNQQGVVVAMHTRGEELGQKLAELLGPAVPPAGSPAPAGANPPGATPPGATPPGGTPPGATPPGGTPPGTEAPAPNTSGGLPADESSWFVSLADEPESTETENTTDDPADDEKANPYLAAAGLSPAELIDYLLAMEEKPLTIQRRPGFAEAIAEAADRVLAADASDKFDTIAALAKFRVLHDRASFDDQQADEQLVKFLEQMKDDQRPKIAAEVLFLSLERKALDADELPLDQLPELLNELARFFEGQTLAQRHLRIASATVHAVNRLEQDEVREQEFQRFGKLFAASPDKELARYGKKIAKSSGPGSSELVGQPLELTGTTTDGEAFAWDTYRGKVVLVDFWATWCGPCRKAMPKVKELYEKHRDGPFDIVGISLDQDLDALAQYLDENKIEWTNLSGEDTQELAKKYGVRGIPTMMLVDAEGKIVAVSHNIDDLTGKLEELLAAGKKAP